MITTPSEKSQEAMNAKTLRVPPALLGDDLPSGGTEGQVLTMGSTGPEWDDPDYLPEGGTEGKVLTMGATDPEWADPAVQTPFALPYIAIGYSGTAITLPTDGTGVSLSGSDLSIQTTVTSDITQKGINILTTLSAQNIDGVKTPCVVAITGLTGGVGVTDQFRGFGYINKMDFLMPHSTYRLIADVSLVALTYSEPSSPISNPKEYRLVVDLSYDETGETPVLIVERGAIYGIQASIGELPTGGAQGQVLTMGASAPEWANAASGGVKVKSLALSLTTDVATLTALTEITSGITVSGGSSQSDFDGNTAIFEVTLTSNNVVYIGSLLARRSTESAYNNRVYLTGFLKAGNYLIGSGMLQVMIPITVSSSGRAVCSTVCAKYEAYAT